MCLPATSPYKAQSAVLFLIFNRPETTAKVFEQIRIAQPARLYVAADAPRAGNAEDIILCVETRAIINNVDWKCEVKTFFKEENEGCKDAVSSAIGWFFDNEEEGIILEDDCLPANSFFRFCDTLLDYYRDDTRIRHITGCNLQEGKKWGDASYYFSNRTHVWGWASWRRVWNDYDLNLESYDTTHINERLLNVYSDPLVADCWATIFKRVKAGEVNSWAYPLDFINFFNNGLVIIPNENLVSNIGYGAGATNTVTEEHVFGNVPLVEMGEIIHPVFMVPEKQADLFIMNHDFHIEEKRRKERSLGRKIKRLFKAMFSHAAL